MAVGGTTPCAIASAQAAIAAYPELGVTGKQLEVWPRWGVNANIFNPSEKTILFLQDVLTEAFRFELIKLLKVAPAITEAVALDTDGRERLKVSRVRMLLPDDLRDRSMAEAFKGGAARLVGKHA